MTNKEMTPTDVELTSANDAKAKAVTRGPIKNRSCTDIICLLLFILFIAGFVIISIFAYMNGNPRLLLYPVDTEGNRCGLAPADKSIGVDFLKMPFLHFFDLSECVTAKLNNTKITKIVDSLTDFSCDTRQVCVEKCPDETAFYLLATEKQKEDWPCVYDVTKEDRLNKNKFEELVKAKKCAPYVVKSEDIFKRCFPGDNEQKQILEFVKDMIAKSLKSDNTTSDFEEKLQDVMKAMMDIQGTISKMMTDFTTSWPFLIVLLCIACVVCFIWIVIMRWLAAPMVWFSLIAFVGIFGFGTYYCVDKYLNDDSLVKDKALEWTTDLNSIKQNRNTWLGLTIICAALLVILLLMLIFLRSRIKIAIALIKEASKAVGCIMSSLVWPIFPFFLQLGLFVGWGAVMLFLVTSSKPIFVISGSNNATVAKALEFNETAADVANGKSCGSLAGKIRFTIKYNDTDAKCIYSHDGPNPDDPLFNQISGVTDSLDWAKVYVIFGLLWFMNFIHALGEMTLAGAFASWYWAFDKKSDVPMLPLLASFWRCLRYHLGTLAFGSLIIAIVQMIRLMLEYVDRKLKNNENEVAKFVMKCLKCFFWCLEKFLKFINRNAYIMCAVHGRHFCASAKKAFMLILENCVRAMVLDKVVDFLLFIGKFAVVGAMGLLSFAYYTGELNSFLPKDTIVDLNYVYVPIIIVIIATYYVSSGFFSVYAMAVDTLFLCFLEDISQNDGSPEKPYFMSKNLMKILGKKNQDPEGEAKKKGCCGCC